MTFLMIFAAVLLANVITVACIAGWLIYQRKRQRRYWLAAIERDLDGLHKLWNDLQKDEQNEVRH